MTTDATVYPPEPPLLDRYRVERTLGEGGLGTVVQAYDTRLKRTVAIKTLRRTLLAADPERARALEERFAREAEAGSRVGNHPNIVAVYDLVIAPDNTQYLILEFVPGGTLADLLKSGAVPLAEALRLTTDAAKGLGAAHAVGIVHRDVKPANLFLAADGRVKVGDFGIAQIDDLSGRTHTTVGHPGTPLYMSPEQSSSTGYVRPATDQYSLGLVLFELLTGTAYKRLGTRDISAALGRMPSPVAAVIERMTALNPDFRYPDMETVVAALAAAVDAERTNPFPGPRPDLDNDETLPFPRPIDPVVPAPHIPPAPTPTAGTGISRRMVIIGGAIVAAGGIGGAIFATTRQPGPAIVATATMQPGTNGTPLPTPTTVLVSLGGTATAAGATMAPSPTTAPPAATPVPATITPMPMPPTAPPAPPPPTPVPATVTLPPPTAVPPTATTPPPPSPSVPPAPPSATPQLLRPGTVVVPTAFPITVTRVQDRFRDLPGGTSVVFTDISTNTDAIADGDRVVPAAALIDIFVIAETYHQVEAKMLGLNTTLSIPTNPVGGTGVLQRRPGGTTTVSEAITLITTESDNLATNLLMDRVGMDKVNETIQVHGLQDTQLRRHLGDEDARKRGIDNVTTAKDMALFFNLIARGLVYTPYVSTSLITAMGQQQKPEWDYLGGAIMPRPQIVHMPGQFPPSGGDPGVLHDVGIVYYGEYDAYVLAFLNQSATPNAEIGQRANQLSADVYRIVTGK